MILTRMPLFGIEDTVTRPIVITVTDDIKELIGVSRDVYTTYDIKDTITKEKNKLGNIQTTNTVHDESITAEYFEDSVDGMELSMLPNKPDTYPIYKDEDIGSQFLPVYHNRTMTINFKFSSKSKSKIFSIINRLRLYTSNDGMYKRHELEYHYVLPLHLLKLLAHINSLKNIRLPSNKQLDLDKYAESTFDDRADFANTLDGNSGKTDLVIREAQLEVQGYITGSLHNIKPERDDETSTWSVSFEYQFRYEKLVVLFLSYPIVIYNNIIAKEFRTFKKDKMPNRNAIRHKGSKDLHALTDRDSLYAKRSNNEVINIPKEDSFDIKSTPSFITRIFSILTMVDYGNPTELFNLAQIPKYSFKENIIDFIISEREYINQMHHSIFYFELYRDGKIDSSNKLLIDEEGNLTTEVPMDIMSTYRVVISIINDLSLVRQEHQNRIKLFIKQEVEASINAKRNLAFKDTVHIDSEEVYQDKETLIDSYFSLFTVEDRVITNMVKDMPVEEMLFRFTEPKYAGMMTKQLHHTLAGVLETK